GSAASRPNLCLFDAEPAEAADRDVLLDPGPGLRDQVCNADRRVSNECLFEQDVLAIEGLDLAVRHLVDRAPLFHGLVWHLVAAPPPRRPAGDVESQLAGQRSELSSLGHEVTLAVELHHGADLGRVVLACAVQVGLDHAVAGLPAGAFSSSGDASLTQEADGSVDVTAAVLKRLAAVHHAGACQLSEPLQVVN